MDKERLSSILKAMCENAPADSKVAMIHLFGILFADEIQVSDASLSYLAKESGIGDSYVTEISKGRKLSEYVDVKPDTCKRIYLNLIKSTSRG